MRLRASVTNVALLAGLLRTSQACLPRHGSGRVVPVLLALYAHAIPADRPGGARWRTDLGDLGRRLGVCQLPHRVAQPQRNHRGGGGRELGARFALGGWSDGGHAALGQTRWRAAAELEYWYGKSYRCQTRCHTGRAGPHPACIRDEFDHRAYVSHPRCACAYTHGRRSIL